VPEIEKTQQRDALSKWWDEPNFNSSQAQNVMVAAGITVAGVLAGDLIMLYYRRRTMMNRRSY
jgi:hypothetical protein